MSNSMKGSSFSLVIAEKPDAARRIASGLGNSTERRFGGISVFEVPRAFDGKRYLVTSAAGHLYGLADPEKLRRVYPVFDVEWFPLSSLLSKTRFPNSFRKSRNNSKLANNISRRIDTIEDLVLQSEEIVQACDYDIEGETIGYNILEFAFRKAKTAVPVLRAKFSTLTESEIRVSFSELKQYETRMAEAGRARHLVDFIWGVNLSRAITEAQRKANQEYKNLTIGRVQGPTLAFVVDRDIKSRTHVPLPYWLISALLRKDQIDFNAQLQSGSISTKNEAEKIYLRVSNEKIAKVVSGEENNYSEHPPYPFNLSDLQRESFRIYRISPMMTLSIAERLYLRALISYPRTTSQKLPAEIGYSAIINRLLMSEEYSAFSSLLNESKRRRFPIQGNKDDPAHPAIYPTGFKPKNSLSVGEKKIFDLIARRFMACFSEDALRKQVVAHFAIGDFVFVANGDLILKKGWQQIYPWLDSGESILPPLSKGEEAQVISIDLNSKFTEPRRLYSSASLLAKMESEKIGTKATRAETISTLIGRGYVSEDSQGRLTSTEVGLALEDALNKYCPQITSTSLTRKTEELIEEIQNGAEEDSSLIQATMKNVLTTLDQIRKSEYEIGTSLLTKSSSPKPSREKRKENRNAAKPVLIGKCPSCSTGNLRIIRSSKTSKRFLGCTNYKDGCRTSAPLPQRGIVMRLGRICEQCKWPMIAVKFSYKRRDTWELCPNVRCPTKANVGR